MNNYKVVSMILVVLLASLAACTNQAAQDTNLGSEGEGQNINQGIPAGEEPDSESGLEEKAEMDITEITWQWVRFDDTAGSNDIVVSDPSLFTLILDADGRYYAKVDCNQANGSYTLEGSSITFEPGPMTRAACQPDSLDGVFLDHFFNVVTFVIEGENLILNLAADGGNMFFSQAIREEAGTESEITGITWQWVRFDDTADLNNIQVADPTLYTLVLNSDGTYTATVDCNQVMGSYTLEGSSVTFEPGITTLAECGPESHYNTFLSHLDNVVTFVMDGDQLVLNLWADGGNMVFAPAE